LDRKHKKYEIRLHRNKLSTKNMLIMQEVQKEADKLTHW